MILYILWNGASYFVTDYWAYELYKKYIQQNNLQMSVVAASTISIILVVASLLLYIICYFLHHYCACCCRSRYKNEPYADTGYSNFSLPMREKIEELEAMDRGPNQEVLRLA